MEGREKARKLISQYGTVKSGGKRATEYVDEVFQFTHDPTLGDTLPNESSAKEKAALMLLPFAYEAILTWLHTHPEGKDLTGLIKKKPEEQKHDIVVASKNTQLTAEEQAATKYEKTTTKTPSELASQRKEELERGGVPTGEGKREQSTAKEPRISDYYAVLGQPPNATPEQLKSAYRKLQKEKNYDFAAGELRKQNPDITTSEIDEKLRPLTAEIQDINIAFAVLNTTAKREAYDRVYKQEYPTEWQAANDPNYTTGFTIVASPTVPSSKQTAKAQRESKYINDLIQRSGTTSLSAQELENISYKGDNIPENISSSSIVSAKLLARMGHDPKKIAELSENPNLSPEARTYLANTAFAMESFRLANPSRYNMLQLSNQNPDSSIAFSTPQNAFSSLSVKQIGSRFVPTIEKFKGQVRNLLDLRGFDTKSASEINSLIGKAISQYGAEAIERLGLKALGKAAMGKLAGSALGTLLAGPVGTLIGAALVWMGEKLLDLFKSGVNWLKKQFGNSPEAVAALGLGAMFINPLLGIGILSGLFLTDGKFRKEVGVMAILGISFVGSFIATSIASYFIIIFLGFVLATALILFIINSGGYVTPHWASTLQAGASNPYIAIAAIGGAPVLTNPTGDQTVTYTFTITAKAENLTNFKIPQFNCNISNVSSSLNCPNPSPNLPDLAGLTLSPGQSHTFTYALAYNPSHSDSLALNSITITADAVSQKSVQETASASTCIGTCPQDCPSIWPTNHGRITQGSNTNSSHEGAQAIDIGGVGDGTEILATHGGVVEFVDNPSCEGNIVMIKSTCNGREFKSRYSHMLTRNILPGTRVQKGQFIGTTNNSGSSACSTGSHLHYQLIGLPMSQPWIPENVQPVQNCCTDCGTTCTTSW